MSNPHPSSTAALVPSTEAIPQAPLPPMSAPHASLMAPLHPKRSRSSSKHLPDPVISHDAAGSRHRRTKEGGRTHAMARRPNIPMNSSAQISNVSDELKQLFGAHAVPKLERVMSTLRKLFSEYSQTKCANSTPETTQVNTQKDESFDDWDQYQRDQLRTQPSSELNAYLAENNIPRTDEFDIFSWWKSNSRVYPILARIACDILSVPASTVPTEAAFSTGERVISDFRSRLSTDTIEALICLQDWMRAASPSPEKLLLEVVAQPVYKISINTLLGSGHEVAHVEDRLEDLPLAA